MESYEYKRCLHMFTINLQKKMLVIFFKNIKLFFYKICLKNDLLRWHNLFYKQKHIVSLHNNVIKMKSTEVCHQGKKWCFLKNVSKKLKNVPQKPKMTIFLETNADVSKKLKIPERSAWIILQKPVLQTKDFTYKILDSPFYSE